MKKNFIRIFFVGLICLFLSYAANAQPKMGGYRSISTDDAGAAAAAEFALAEKSKEFGVELSLEEIKKAEVQVVAGKNYRLCLVIYAPSKEPETDGVQLFIQTVIYQNLKGEYKITSWEDSECDQEN